MFVRFRHAEPGLHLSSLVNIPARHEHVASLGAIPIESSAVDRAAFWEQLTRRLASLGISDCVLEPPRPMLVSSDGGNHSD